ncbi:MAG: ABC transporter [Bacteroidia bacterium]|nr:MAG: ABC transporter [Bacteroidia bacterium]
MTQQQPIISIKNLEKSYGTNNVLKGIDLDIMLKILCGLIPEFSGDVNILGFDLKKDSLDIKRRIGYIPENADIYDTLTPMEYLHFVGELQEMDSADIQQKIEKLLALFDMQKHADERMDSFSKGMKQKILIISGLLHNPDIIFMDEPLSGLDANAVIVVKEILSKLAKEGKTIFYSSHIMDVVEKISNRIILIDKGKVIADGSFSELNHQAQTGSLEILFTQLTGTSGHSQKAEEIINVFENNK